MDASVRVIDSVEIDMGKGRDRAGIFISTRRLDFGEWRPLFHKSISMFRPALWRFQVPIIKILTESDDVVSYFETQKNMCPKSVAVK